MFHRMLRLTLILSLLTGCTMTGRLYNLQTGQVVNATFTYSGSGAGKIQVPLPTGEICTGEYVTVAGGSVSWGSIFGTVYGSGVSVTGSGTAVGESFEGKQRGSAIATGNRGTVIECEYVTSIWSPTHGYGACRDNHGGGYKLMF